MKIRNKMALQFTLIVAAMLSLYLFYTYFYIKSSREKEFYKRLEVRAEMTAKLLTKVQEIDKRIMKKIDQNTFTNLFAEKVLIFNEEDQLVYSSIDSKSITFSPDLINLARKNKYVEAEDGERKFVAKTYFDTETNENLVLIASALDDYGQESLANLINTLTGGLFVGLFATIFLSVLFASQSLQPISYINARISKITAENLEDRLDEGNRQDEIAQLAMNFNKMLSRLNSSFELQKGFVSSASHELRTPLAALKTEIQVAMETERSTEEHNKILKTLMIDTDRLIALVNSLLILARSETKGKESMREIVRVDEVLFECQRDLNNFKPNYNISIEYDDIPDDENALSAKGNHSLLKTLFSNLIDNACKYSTDHRAQVTIKTHKNLCEILIKDNGVGIPEQELHHIFDPFFRTKNVQEFKGFGIGLSISKRIAQMHNGEILVISKLGKGTIFTVQIPNMIV